MTRLERALTERMCARSSRTLRAWRRSVASRTHPRIMGVQGEGNVPRGAGRHTVLPGAESEAFSSLGARPTWRAERFAMVRRCVSRCRAGRLGGGSRRQVVRTRSRWSPSPTRGGCPTMFAHCWSTWFHPDCAEREQRSTRRALKQRLVADGIAHAALVYNGARAVAWAEYGSPEELPDIHHRKEYLAMAERLPDYRVTCILLKRGLRGQGLAAIALRGASRADRAGRRRPGRGPPSRHWRGPEDELVVRLQPHPHDVRARGLHLRSAQGTGVCVMMRKVDPSTRD